MLAWRRYEIDGGAHMHDAIGGGSKEGDAKIEPGGQHYSALIHNAGRSLPDGHLEHICAHRWQVFQYICHHASQEARNCRDKLPIKLLKRAS